MNKRDPSTPLRTGFELKYTHIDHIARERLGLTLNEYCVCDTVYQLSNNPRSRKPGWCTAKREYIGSYISVKRRGTIYIVRKMEELGLIRRDADDDLQTTDKWYNVVVVRTHARLAGMQRLHGKRAKSSPEVCKDCTEEENTNGQENKEVTKKRRAKSTHNNNNNINDKSFYNTKTPANYKNKEKAEAIIKETVEGMKQ